MIGVYDVFSATLAARQFGGLFLSGFSFAASHYGLPDHGYIAWTDMLAFAERVRTILPDHHLLVDIDDGYGDPEIVAHVVQRLERAGVSGIVLEDQQRPRRCGHYEGKQILPVPDYLEKLKTQKGIVIDQQIIPGANHFFDGKLEPLMETVTGYLDMRLANVR
jgi:2-methylisocitrate lyase-like PEP mutase family enzyme